LAWNVIPTHTFRRDFRELAPEIRGKVEEAIQALSASEDPRKLGHRLHDRWEGSYSFEVGLQYRIIYRLNLAAKVIELMAAGTRKIYR
jgi:mRNA-degrading endonuclease RelE of RelBE toxin-antitoxin system